MPAFRFQLEGVLRHRKNIERERQRQLAVFQGQQNQLQSELRRLDQDVQDATAELRGTRLIGQLDMNYLAAHRRFVAAMQRKAMGIVQKMAIVQRDLEQARKALAEAAKQRKIMEKLRERHWQRWLDDLNRKEGEAINEIGMQLAFRQLADEQQAIQASEAT